MSSTTSTATSNITPLSGSQATQRLLPFALLVFLGYLSVGMPLAVLPGYIHETLDFGPTVVGWVIATQSIGTLLTRQFAGLITDTRGAKNAVIVGTVGCALAGLGYGISGIINAMHIWSLVALLAGRAMLGLGESLLITGALSWCIGTVGPRHTGRAMVWVGIAMFGAIGAGAPIGAAIMNKYGFMAVAATASVLPLFALTVGLRKASIAPNGGRRLAFHKVVGLIWRHGMALALSTVGFGTLFAFLGLDYAAQGWSGAPYGLTAFGIAYVAARLFFGGLPDQLGGQKVAMVTIPIQGLGLIALWLAPNPVAALAGSALLGAGYSLTFPALGVDAVRYVPPQNRGAAMGAYVAFVDIGLGITGPIAGTVASHFNYTATFFVAAIATIVAIFAAVQAHRKDGTRVIGTDSFS